MSKLGARRSFRNASFVAASELLRKGVLYIATIIVARALGVEDFGTFSTVMATGAILALAADFGFADLSVREISRGGGDTYLSRLIPLKLALSVLSVGLAVVVAIFTPADGWLVLLATAYYILTSSSLLALGVVRGHERMHYETGVRVLEFGALLAMLALYASGGRIGVGSTIGLFAISAAIGVASSVLAVRIATPARPSRLRWHPTLLRDALPFALTLGLFLVYYRLNILLLSWLIGPAASGQFNAAYQIILGIMVLPLALAAGLYPALVKTRGTAEFNKLLRRQAALAAAAGVVTAIGVYFLAGFGVELLYGPEFASSAAVLAVLGLGLPAMFTTCILTVGLQAKDHAHRVTIIAAMNLAISASINLLLIPKLGVSGAALALVLTEYFSLGAMIVAMRREPQEAPTASSSAELQEFKAPQR